MNEITELERSVMDLLLQGEHPVLEALRVQWRSARVKQREMTGVGFFTYFLVDRSAGNAAPGQKDFRIGDVDAAISGLRNGAGFVLFVRNGFLDNLEAYTYDEPWPESPSGFNVAYSDGVRDLKKLGLDSLPT